MKFYNFESFLFITVTFFSTVFGYYKIIDDELAGSFDDTLLYNDFCLQDNKDVCNIYSKVLMRVIEQVNVDEVIEEPYNLQIFVDNLNENGYTKNTQMVELNTRFKDTFYGYKYPKNKKMSKLIKSRIKPNHKDTTDLILVFNNFKNNNNVKINVDSITKIVEDGISRALIDMKLVDKSYKIKLNSKVHL
ncbi:hypothetical protein PIROE2DRAFT_19000 [Piromyces sp. E2]|nr:hypothetical protein PIROE2DRAFT_19000 [Piromyces sp. E2]|eukprot:OUM56404.1 hypothetical protein PIROE2DRAFT_19000 [Piromyces sp. E2]